MAIFRRGPPNGGVECRWGRQKSLLSKNIWLSDRRLLEVVRSTFDGRQCIVCNSYDARLFTAQKATHQWIRRREENTIEFKLRSGKSEAKVTSNKRIEDDTKAATRQSSKCIRKKYSEERFSIWRLEFFFTLRFWQIAVICMLFWIKFPNVVQIGPRAPD